MIWKWALIVDFVLAIALAVMALCAVNTPWIVAGCVVLAAGVILAFVSGSKALGAVENGIYLLRSQDYSSRLRHVGNPDADRVVDFFNSLMAAMRSERLRAEEQNHLLDLLIQSSPQGIAICDYDGNITQCNPAFKAISAIETEAAFARLAAGQQQMVTTASGDVLRCSRLGFMDSGFERPFLMIERITDEVRGAEKDLFVKIVRTIAHEVNNTMCSVMTTLDAVGSVYQQDTEMSQTLGSCINGCSRLADFVKSYSDIVKLPAPQLEDLNLTLVMRDMMPLLQGLIPDNVSLQFESTNSHTTAMCDIVLLERVMVNAVKNAVESIGDKVGNVSIKVDGKALSVTDDGPGISPDVAPHIFTPFFSTKDASMESGAVGSSVRGLGLMLISDVLKGHGAKFSLRTVDGITSLSILFR